MQIIVHHYLAFSSLLVAVSLLGVHLYIKFKLQEDHDDGYLFFASAFLIWFFLSWYEGVSGGNDSVIRRLLSVFNTACWLYGMSYLKDGLFPQLRHLQRHRRWYVGGLAIATLFALVAGDKNQFFAYFEFLTSFVVLLILFLSMAKVFYTRHLHIMAIVAILAGILNLSVQLFGLSDIQSVQYPSENYVAQVQYFKQVEDKQTLDPTDYRLAPAPDYAPEFWLGASAVTNRDFVRLAARLMLIICLLVLALSWLGRQIKLPVSSTVLEPPPARGPILQTVEALKASGQPFLAFQQVEAEYLLYFRQAGKQVITVDMSDHPIYFERLRSAGLQQKNSRNNYFTNRSFTNRTQAFNAFDSCLTQASKQQISLIDIVETIQHGRFRYRWNKCQIHLL